jgi:hypothetical protein
MLNLSKLMQRSVQRPTRRFNITGSRKLNKVIMNTGEGSAIAKAGTSTVRAVLKTGSRVIKNGL